MTKQVEIGNRNRSREMLHLHSAKRVLVAQPSLMFRREMSKKSVVRVAVRLVQDVDKVGAAGDVVSLKPGFSRYLVNERRPLELFPAPAQIFGIAG